MNLNENRGRKFDGSKSENRRFDEVKLFEAGKTACNYVYLFMW